MCPVRTNQPHSEMEVFRKLLEIRKLTNPDASVGIHQLSLTQCQDMYSFTLV